MQRLQAHQWVACTDTGAVWKTHCMLMLRPDYKSRSFFLLTNRVVSPTSCVSALWSTNASDNGDTTKTWVDGKWASTPPRPLPPPRQGKGKPRCTLTLLEPQHRQSFLHSAQSLAIEAHPRNVQRGIHSQCWWLVLWKRKQKWNVHKSSETKASGLERYLPAAFYLDCMWFDRIISSIKEMGIRCMYHAYLKDHH